MSAHVQHWYDRRLWAVLTALGAALLAYGALSLAIDSGNSLYYAATVALALLSLNRISYLTRSILRKPDAK